MIVRMRCAGGKIKTSHPSSHMARVIACANWLGGAQLREKDMPTPTAAHKNLIMASLVHLSFPSACHGLFLVVFFLLMVAANEYPDSSCSGM